MTGKGVVVLLVVCGWIGAPFIVDRLLFVRNKSGFDAQRIHWHERSRRALVCPTDRRSLVSQQVIGLWVVVLFTLIGLFGILTHVLVGGSIFAGVVVFAGIHLRSLWNNWGATFVLDSEGIRWQARFDSWFVPWDAINEQGTPPGWRIASSGHIDDKNVWFHNMNNNNNAFKSYRSLVLNIEIRDPEAVEREGWFTKLKLTDIRQRSWVSRVLLWLRERPIPTNKMVEAQKEDMGDVVYGTFTWKCLDISVDELETTVQHFLTHPDDRERIEYISSVRDIDMK